jgi:glycosyltransferase involved in cell wall biosynthesis
MTSRKKILEIVFKNPKDRPGGLETYCLNLSHFLINHNIVVEYAFTSNGDFLFSNRIKEIEILDEGTRTWIIGHEFVIAKFWRYASLAKLIYSIYLLKFLKKNLQKYDVIHINGDNGGFVSSMKGPLKIMTWHGSSRLNYKGELINIAGLINKIRFIIHNKISAFLEEYSSRNSDIVTSVSPKLFEFIEQKTNRGEIIFTPPMVDSKTYNSQTVDRNQYSDKFNYNPLKRLALFVGKDPIRKRLHVAIESVCSVRNFELIAITSASKSSRNGCDKIHFLTNVSDEDLNILYNICDVLIFPSKSEGLPTVILEAMSCGCVPIMFENIAKTIPSLSDGINCFVVKEDREILEILQKIESGEIKLKPISESAKNTIGNNYTIEQVGSVFLSKII